MKRYEIERIQCQWEKGSPIKALSQGLLVDGKGLDGDFHSVGGDKQLTLIGSVLEGWMENQVPLGLCFARVKANLILKGSLSNLEQGELLTLGDAQVVITQRGKGCPFENCPVGMGQCALQQEMCYALVIRGGAIKSMEEESICPGKEC
ncbi:hypothetical protein [Eubacterium aggregans]|uniref:hypothetical protein n=1 Tax=Eubacterium aggregans TaxID=81409 RepID=UPI003F3E10AD